MKMEWSKSGNEIKKSVRMERDCVPIESCECNLDGCMEMSLQKDF